MDNSKEDILSALRESDPKGLRVKEIARKIGARSKAIKNVRKLISELESEGEIVRTRRRRYQLAGEAGYITGTIIGYGFDAVVFVPSDDPTILRVSDENLGGAHHGDHVLARILRGAEGEEEARVVRVMEKASSEVVGQVSGGRGRRFVSVKHEAGVRRVAVEEDSDARVGDHVLVRVARWGEAYEKARGRITEVLGGRFTPGEDFASIARQFNLPLGFPKAVADEVASLSGRISEEELERRQDLIDLLIFTIDPEDAKDFDDAISVEDLGKGRLRIGVHIADVSHYVRQGGHLDYEALARGRSIYLVDRVIPMLPPRLSSSLAALRPGEPRLAMSVMMDVTEGGEVESYSITESLIKSRARLTYDRAQELLDRGPGWRGPSEMKKVTEALRMADVLKDTLKQNRIRRGAIELETPEIDIVVDSLGNTVEVRPVRRLDSHSLIEELMILANETVAKHMSYLGRLFMYRVHEVPDEQNMKDLAVFASTFGYRYRWTKGTSPAALQSLLTKIKGTPEESIISVFLLRSLKKAQYSQRNVGHYGLASKCYTHFTSPIRRYADLVVHRLIKAYGLDRSSPKDGGNLLSFLKKAASIASLREVEGDEAERASIKAKVAEFMESRIGEEHWGIISGVKDFGFFVMLEENLVEGLVHVSSLGDDYYAIDSTGTMLVGSSRGLCYRIGDRVRVKVVGVDRARREVDFMVVAKATREGDEVEAIRPLSRSRARKLYKELRKDVERARSSGRRRGRSMRSQRRKSRTVTRSVKSRRLLRMKRVTRT